MSACGPLLQVLPSSGHLWRALAMLTVMLCTSCSPAGGGSDQTTANQGTSNDSDGPPFELSPSFVLGLDAAENSAQLYRPNSVAIDEHGEIFVLDAGNQRVVVFDSAGSMLREFGRGGAGPGEFFLGADMGDEIVVSDGTVYVMEKQRQRIQGLTKTGEPVSSFALSDIIWKIDVKNELVYVSLKQSVRGLPTVGVFTPQGVLIEHLGEAEFTRNDARIDRLNMVYSAASSDGTVRQAYQHLPRIRRVSGPAGDRDNWFDFSWWRRGELRVWVTQGNSKQDFEAMRVAPGDADPPRRVVFWDLERVDSTDEWWVVMYNSVAQSFASSGRPLRSYKLLPDEREAVEAITDPQDIGLDPAGETLCAADRKESIVRCYDLPAPGGDRR